MDSNFKNPMAAHPMHRLLMQVLTSHTRLPAPNGDLAKKITWKEYLVIREDPEWQSASTYWQNLYFYANGVDPRPSPIRVLFEREVGVYRGKIYYLADAGPSDHGEGAYYQVSRTAPVLYQGNGAFINTAPAGDTPPSVEPPKEQPLVILTGSESKP